jgi:hypothetical protein
MDTQVNNTLKTKGSTLKGRRKELCSMAPAGPKAGQRWNGQIFHKKENGEGKGVEATGIEPETAIQTRDHGAPTPPQQTKDTSLFQSESIPIKNNESKVQSSHLPPSSCALLSAAPSRRHSAL